MSEQKEIPPKEEAPQQEGEGEKTSKSALKKLEKEKQKALKKTEGAQK